MGLGKQTLGPTKQVGGLCVNTVWCTRAESRSGSVLSPLSPQSSSNVTPRFGGLVSFHTS